MVTQNGKGLEPGEFFFVTDNVNYLILQPSDLVSLKVTQNYTTITTTAGKEIFIRRALNDCESRLPQNFFRANRWEVVNLEHVTKIVPIDAKRLLFTLSTGTTVRVSRVQTLEFRRTRNF